MTKTRTRSASNAPGAPTTPTPKGPTPARRNAASADLEDPPARPRPAASSSTVGYLDAHNGTHSFTFSVASATTDDLVSEPTTRVKTLDERLRACDRKVSQSVEAARAESVSLCEEQAAHLKTKQQLALLEVTSEANNNAAKKTLAMEHDAHAATRAGLHTLQASLRALFALLPSAEV
ncbi:unnamed protein product [Tilletia controversa]|uniref:Uncharacterized protein n=3 Tax=Tilletia TaxID=13289 RepID=A0A8X7SZ08_9BASI|nr:hypothetical protein CF335_g9166 [Tilletia laevis]KAE8189030.1 hypothetical protein CF328_g6408 [Tilletia controversa]KAE8240987.1 hypothetical protein A4X03_0g8241 [Tilletia caries]KAE8183095.1 hypothetical protein CF336_g8302 [Tilletia laevis]KAE8252708.1 hypothetical protein A4X06_0g1991 [Tilletia controversa]